MKISKAQFNRTAAVAAGILLIQAVLAACAPLPSPRESAAFVAPEAAKAPPRSAGVFDTLATELLMNMEPGRRIAIQSFRPTDVPVALPVAQGFNDSLARAIESTPDGAGIIVAREELPRLFSEAEEFGDASGAQRLLESVRADVLVIGTVKTARAGVDISYKAFDARNGHQLAATTPQFLAMDASLPAGLSLDQALAVAADALAREASDLKAVESLGITYQQSDTEPPLGGYIGRTLVGRLLEKTRSRSATPAALLRPDASPSGHPGVYLLSGTLWDLGSDVEARLSLRGPGDTVSSYGVRIRRDTIPPGMLALDSPRGPAQRRDDGAAPAIVLSSDRGQRPVYGIGESARLLVQTARDGYLYCFHQASAAAGGGITKIFPNPYHPDARILKGAGVRIPDERMGFALRVQGPAGVEQVRCFATDRDLAGSLSAGIMGAGLEPIGLTSLADLDRIFRSLPAATTADATLVMTITPAVGVATSARVPVRNAP